MYSSDVRKKYIEFFKKQKHIEIPSAPLVPENDPTTLFNSSGMQPLVPFLLGETHPSGKRLVNSQKAIRLQDIDEVGDNRHTTFFEMLGNWSLGDYFKKEQLPWVFDFLTNGVGLDPQRIYVTVFEGNDSVPKDMDSIEIWKEIFSSRGIQAKENERIFSYAANKNWWSRSGEPEKMPPGEPGGPDSEIFFDYGEHLKIHEDSKWSSERCHPNCDCGRFMEIGNSVFMQYKKIEDGSLMELPQKNVDFGGGLERIVAASNNDRDVFKTDFFVDFIRQLEVLAEKKYGENEEDTKAMRIIADHLRACIFIISDGIVPSFQKQGYVLRRLLRRAITVSSRLMNYEMLRDYLQEYRFNNFLPLLLKPYESAYPEVYNKRDVIEELIREEWFKFEKNMKTGYPEIVKVIDKSSTVINGEDAFYLLESHGILPGVLEEVASKYHKTVDWGKFQELSEKHKEKSRTAAAGMFKGGLADHSENTTRLHTAHHLFLAALQKLVDPEIKQKGSNITGERLRLDVNLNRKLTEDEIIKIEDLVNEKIAEGVPVLRIDMTREEAETVGAQMEFGKKYPDKVSVYFVGSQDNFFSAEFCGGPHVTNTSELGTGNRKFKILKEENIGSGLKRFKAALVTSNNTE